MAKLNDKQKRAVDILALPKRGGMTYKQVAEEVGIAESTLHEWRKLDAFDSELKRTIMRSTLDRFPEVMASVPDHIINDGNAAMFRTLLQAYGLLTEKVELETKGTTNNVDDIKAEIERLRNSN